MISLETLRLFKMYIERRLKEFKPDLNKSAAENITERVIMDLTLERVNYMIEIKLDTYEVQS